MFKSFIALFRGRSHEAAQSVVDQNAMIILRQQIRDCAEAISKARKSIAIAISQNEQETEQYEKIVSRITDLEKRTIIALEQGKDQLAKEAAETIAILEAEKDSSLEAQTTFKTEIDRLNNIVRTSEARLRDLQRGQRIADATDKTHRLRQTSEGSSLSALQDAENTLERLRSRQKQMDATATAMDEMTLNSKPATMSEKLAEAGCGAPLKSSADEVLARLSKKVKTPAKA